MNYVLEASKGMINPCLLTRSDLIATIQDIILALSNEYPTIIKQDEIQIKQEEIIRVLLGLGLSDFTKLTFNGKGARKDKLKLSIPELTKQINNLPGTTLNTSILGVVYVLMLNGRSNDLEAILINGFPDYFIFKS